MMSICSSFTIRYNAVTMRDDNKKKETDTTDEVFDTIEVEEADPQELIKNLKEKLKHSQIDRQEYLTGWQRAKADLINARRQDEKDKQEFVKFANERLVMEILPVITNFEMAMANREVWKKVDKNWRVGVEYIYNQLLKVLANHGVQEINPVGQKYDPARDETAGHEPVTDESKDGAVVSVAQKGYSINGKVLKAPRVIVGEYKKE
ncbi:MAG TPA: nucleotide exchange factor GrpE [Candidatus Paceibacterota bacterium]